MLPQRFQNDEPVFRGVRFDVHAVQLDGRDGETVRRELVSTFDSVVILPLLDTTPGAEEVVLIRNERFAVGETLWELPAGTLEPKEDPADCAGRELIEETGYRAAGLEKLTAFYPTPGFVTEFMHAYRATGLTHVGQDLDPNERIEVETMPMSRALELVRSGEVKDAKTVAVLLWQAAFAGRPGATNYESATDTEAS